MTLDIPRGASPAAPIFACGRCHKPSVGLGRGSRLVLGARVWVCASCRQIIDAQRARVTA